MNAVCPGFVPGSAAEGFEGFTKFLFKWVIPILPGTKSIASAGRSIAHAATAPECISVTGKYFGDFKQLVSSPESHDLEKADRFWKLACGRIGLAETLG